MTSRLKGSAMGSDQAEKTKKQIYDWIDASVRQGFGRPTQRDIRNRFGVSHGVSSTTLAKYKKEHPDE